jgi:phosphoesterase RecJ-like protein
MSLTPRQYAAATEILQRYQRLLVIPHANVDPDGLSSALACYQIFRGLGKDVTVICPDTLPESLEFLPGFEGLKQGIDGSQEFVLTINLEPGVEIDKLRYTVEDQKVNIIVLPKQGRIQTQNIHMTQGDWPYDLIVVVDTADLHLLGSIYTQNIDLFGGIPILNIDHHISNTGYGQTQLIDPTAASATEVLYGWFMAEPAMRRQLTADTATLLLTGLITDTRSFQNPNTTPHSLEVAAELLEKGARQQEIIQHIYKTKPLSTLRIWGRALNRIQVDRDARIVWSAVSREDLSEMEATSAETHGLLDELISTIPDADVYVLFTEREEGGLKASLRTSTAVDASALAGKAYGGGGHTRAAGFKVPAFENFALQVLECIQRLKTEMAALRHPTALRAAPTPLTSAVVPPVPAPRSSPAAPSVVAPVSSAVVPTPTPPPPAPVAPVTPMGQPPRQAPAPTSVRPPLPPRRPTPPAPSRQRPAPPTRS